MERKEAYARFREVSWAAANLRDDCKKLHKDIPLGSCDSSAVKSELRIIKQNLDLCQQWMGWFFTFEERNRD